MMGIAEAANSDRKRPAFGKIPCEFPANSLVVARKPLFMRVSHEFFFLRKKIPCSIPCAGNFPGLASSHLKKSFIAAALPADPMLLSIPM